VGDDLGWPEATSGIGVDLRYVRGPSYIGLELREHPDGTVEDLRGVRRRIVTLTSSIRDVR